MEELFSMEGRLSRPVITKKHARVDATESPYFNGVAERGIAIAMVES